MTSMNFTLYQLLQQRESIDWQIRAARVKTIRRTVNSIVTLEKVPEKNKKMLVESSQDMERRISMVSYNLKEFDELLHELEVMIEDCVLSL